jgi:hypothetical protein
MGNVNLLFFFGSGNTFEIEHPDQVNRNPPTQLAPSTQRSRKKKYKAWPNKKRILDRRNVSFRMKLKAE